MQVFVRQSTWRFERIRILTTRILYCLLIALPVASLLLNAISLVRYGIDVPFWDDWRQYDGGHLGDLSLSYLFTPTNDTLYPVGLFLDALAIRMLDGHSVAYQLISLLSVLGALLVIQWRLLGLCLDTPLKRAFAFCFTLPMLQPDSYWGLQNLAFHQAIPLLCVLGILWTALSSLRTRWVIAASSVLAVISGLSYISGAFAAFGLGAVLLFASRFLRPTTEGLAGGNGLKPNHDFVVRLKHAGIAVLIPGTLCMLAQIFVIAVVQKGNHLPDVPLAYPWHGDFWWYTLGKIGRALMLDAQRPAFSATIAISAIVFLGALIFLRIFRLQSQRQVAHQHIEVSHAEYGIEQTRYACLSIVLFALTVIAGLYLGLVAAGRANLRPESIESSLQIFSYAFERFHFFWVTLLWPWMAAAIISNDGPGTSAFGRNLRRAAAGMAALLLLAIIGWGNTFGHAQYYRSVMALRQHGLLCLNEKIAQGMRPLACHPLHPVDTPELLPDDLARSIKHAIAHDASFIRNLYFPSIPLGTRSASAPLFQLTKADQLVPENIEALTESQPGSNMPMRLHSINHDPSVSFSTGQPESLRQCALLDLVARVELPSPDSVQFFYIPGDSSQFSELNSKIIRYQGPGMETIAIRIVSPNGFTNRFRLDPGSQPGRIAIDGIELRCRF